MEIEEKQDNDVIDSIQNLNYHFKFVIISYESKNKQREIPTNIFYILNLKLRYYPLVNLEKIIKINPDSLLSRTRSSTLKQNQIFNFLTGN